MGGAGGAGCADGAADVHPVCNGLKKAKCRSMKGNQGESNRIKENQRLFRTGNIAQAPSATHVSRAQPKLSTKHLTPFWTGTMNIVFFRF